AVDRERFVEPTHVREAPARRDEELHARAAGTCGRCELTPLDVLPERRLDRERIEIDTERSAAELGVVAAAGADGDLREQRPLVAEQDLRRRRPGLDAENPRSGSGR